MPATYEEKTEKAKNYYEEQLKTLKDNYNVSQTAIKDTKRQAEQNASIAYDKLKKYLPMQLKAAGLDGLGGMSETAQIQALNNYTNNIGSIAGNYMSEQSNLMREYNADKLAAEKDYRTMLNELEQQNYEREQYAAQQKRDEQNANYAMAVDAISQNVYTDKAGLEKYIDTLNLNESHKASLNQLAANYGSDSEKVYAEKTAEETKQTVKDALYSLSSAEAKLEYLAGTDADTAKAVTAENVLIPDNIKISGLSSEREGNNFSVTVNGGDKLKVELGKMIDNENIKTTLNTLTKGSPTVTPDDKTVIFFDGKMYIYKGKNWYTVDNRFSTDVVTNIYNDAMTANQTDREKITDALNGMTGGVLFRR